MAYNSNYFENRFQPPKINLIVKDWDYAELINHLARVIGRPFKAQMADDIVEELKRLEKMGWPAIKDTVESLMLMGKAQLSNNLWSLLLAGVNSHLIVKEMERENSWFIPEWERSYELISIQQHIVDEIHRWIKYARMGKPLIYKDKPVVYNEKGLSTQTAEEILTKEEYFKFCKGGISVEMFMNHRSTGSWCILLDVYFAVIKKALDAEYDQQNPDNNAMKEMSMRYLNFLLAERCKQTGSSQ